ncbi:MAG TPA: type II secretion system protein [Candidatus Krumholzibacteria bacterium]|nr:type II secretion system protein [Candidatus Krumholzibacteria bacterium]
MKKNGFTLIELMIVVLIIGLLAAIGIPNFVRLTGNAKEASVKENGHTAQLAAEDWSVQAGGIYPANVLDPNPATGLTIIDMLPKSANLTNPFTHAATEPVDGAAATVGQTGYEPVTNGAGTVIGYVITGYGRANTVLRLSNGQ